MNKPILFEQILRKHAERTQSRHLIVLLLSFRPPTYLLAYISTCLSTWRGQDPLRLGGGGEEHLDRFLQSVEQTNAETEQRLRQASSHIIYVLDTFIIYLSI